jgi:hypothetical protein
MVLPAGPRAMAPGQAIRLTLYSHVRWLDKLCPHARVECCCYIQRVGCAALGKWETDRWWKGARHFQCTSRRRDIEGWVLSNRQ